MGRAGQGERPAGPLNPRRRRDYSSQRRQDCSGTTTALQQDYSSRRSGQHSRSALGAGALRGRPAVTGGAAALSASPRGGPGSPSCPGHRPCAASRLPKEGPLRSSLGRADLPPSRPLPCLRRRTRDAFVRLRALGWARSSARGHGRADGPGAAADHGQVRGGNVRAEPMSSPRRVWGQCRGSGFGFCLLKSLLVWQKLCERCRKAEQGTAGS